MFCNLQLAAWPSAKPMVILPGTAWLASARAGFSGWREMPQRPSAVAGSPLERSAGRMSVIFGHASGQTASKNVGVSVGRVIADSFGKNLLASPAATHLAMSPVASQL